MIRTRTDEHTLYECDRIRIYELYVLTHDGHPFSILEGGEK